MSKLEQPKPSPGARTTMMGSWGRYAAIGAPKLVHHAAAAAPPHPQWRRSNSASFSGRSPGMFLNPVQSDLFSVSIANLEPSCLSVLQLVGCRSQSPTAQASDNTNVFDGASASHPKFLLRNCATRILFGIVGVVIGSPRTWAVDAVLSYVVWSRIWSNFYRAVRVEPCSTRP